MICVEQSDSTQRVIYQRDHAHQAAQMASHWRQPTWLNEAMWMRFWTAVDRHDEGWKRNERLPVVDAAGRPMGFMDMALDQHLPMLITGIDQVGFDDAYAGLLVALHFREIESRHLKSDRYDADLVQRFTQRMDQYIDTALAGLRAAGPAVVTAIAPAHLAAAQRLLGMLDALSLMLIGGLPRSPMERVLPVGEDMLTVSACWEGSVLTLDPWPFEGDTVDAPVTARVLDRTPFETSADLAYALSQASPREIRFQLVRR